MIQKAGSLKIMELEDVEGRNFEKRKRPRFAKRQFAVSSDVQHLTNDISSQNDLIKTKYTALESLYSGAFRKVALQYRLGTGEKKLRIQTKYKFRAPL